jgi:hypothetical protein
VKETMPRPDHPRASKLRDREGDADVNRCGGWSREKLQAMDKRFAEAMERALHSPFGTARPRGITAASPQQQGPRANGGFLRRPKQVKPGVPLPAPRRMRST